MSAYGRYANWKGWSSSSFGHCARDAALYFSRELGLSGVGRLEGVRILEIGFGNGQFAGWTRQVGAAYVGTELISSLVEQGLQLGFDVRSAEAALLESVPDRSVDLVVSFDVFEHMDADALRAMLQSIHRVLGPFGRLVARVPSGDSPFARAIQYGDTTHRTVIGSSMVRQLADESNFEVLDIRAPAFPLGGNGLLSFSKRACVQLVRLVVYPIIKFALMGGGAPVLTPNMVFVFMKREEEPS